MSIKAEREENGGWTYTRLYLLRYREEFQIIMTTFVSGISWILCTQIIINQTEQLIHGNSNKTLTNQIHFLKLLQIHVNCNFSLVQQHKTNAVKRHLS